MIRPVRFAFNPQTAVDNAFQRDTEAVDVQQKALAEFDAFVVKLRENGLDVLVVDDLEEPHTPDSIFPNNWISMHSNGALCLYPMKAVNRRLERDPRIVGVISNKFKVRKVIDLTGFEKDGEYLEGTGSMVLDRKNRIAYASLSERTSRRVLEEFCRKLPYKPLTFHSSDAEGRPVYHTNVVMCVARTFVVVCLDAVRDLDERESLSSTISAAGKEIIPITIEQMASFAGNMLQVVNGDGKLLLVMSSRAHGSLTEDQLRRITAHNEVLHSPLDTIETHGGGSARCMIAEIFLPERKLWFQF